MKRLLFLSMALIVLTGSFASTNVTIKPRLNASEILIPLGPSGQKISLLQLSQMRIRDVEAFRGEKMKFSDRLIFKVAQNRLRRTISADGTIDSRLLNTLSKKFADVTSGFNLGGFALGLLLGLIGVLIAYLIKSEPHKARVKWAWIGFAVWVVLSLIFFVL